MTLKNVSERSGIPYSTVVMHKAKGLLPVSFYDGKIFVTEEGYTLYLKALESHEREKDRVIKNMLLSLDKSIGETRVDRISDNDMDAFQIALEPLVRNFQEELTKIISSFLPKW